MAVQYVLDGVAGGHDIPVLAGHITWALPGSSRHSVLGLCFFTHGHRACPFWGNGQARTAPGCRPIALVVSAIRVSAGSTKLCARTRVILVLAS